MKRPRIARPATIADAKIRRYPDATVPASPVRLTFAQARLLFVMVGMFVEAHTGSDDCNMALLAHHADAVLRGLPAHAPYDLELDPIDWPVVSMALRPVTRPKRGSIESQARALYSYLIKRGYGRVPVPRVPRLTS